MMNKNWQKILIIISIIVVLLLTTSLILRNVFKSNSGFKESGDSKDGEIIYLRSIQGEYEIPNVEKRSESENDRGCKEQQGLFGDKWISCYKRITWSYDGHEIFEDLDQLARSKNMSLGDYYAKAGNSKYYLGQSDGKKVCFHISENNNADGKLFTNAVLATGNDDICKTKSE